MDNEFHIEKNTVQFVGSYEGVAKLFASLSAAQGVMQGAIKDSQNPHYRSKYADLSSVWDAVRKPLADNGLSIIQIPLEGTDTVRVTTILGHVSGAYIMGTIELKPTKVDPQGAGSAITYARRYALMAFVGVAPEDDDGNAASVPQQKPVATKPKANPNAPVNRDQMKVLWDAAQLIGMTAEGLSQFVQHEYDLDTPAKLTRAQFDAVMKMLETKMAEGV